jgi:hypothetical protein
MQRNECRREKNIKDYCDTGKDMKHVVLLSRLCSGMLENGCAEVSLLPEFPLL